jgi:hypothetical protein
VEIQIMCPPSISYNLWPSRLTDRPALNSPDHQVYPHTVSKSVFIETLLEYSLNNLPAIKKLITANSQSEPDTE